jgi:GntR family transcriptional repressor for pyruvate dehydrogenase complex
VSETPSSLQPHQRQSAADYVMEQLCDLISNDLSAGDKLPSQRELAETLNVSLPSVREPLATLQAIGVIDVRHGSGMFVSERPALGTLLRTLTSILMREVSFEELFAVRETVEVENCRAAARLAGEGDKEALRRQCEKLRRVSSSEEFLSADVEFHLLVGEIGGNELWVLILDMVRTMIESVLRALPEQRDLANDQHDAVTAAIVAGDADAAAVVMRTHLAINLAGLEELGTEGRGEAPLWQISMRRPR